ncbi:hypothetical protein [Aquirufa avitistagni]
MLVSTFMWGKKILDSHTMLDKPFRNIATVRDLDQANSLISCGVKLLFKHVDRNAKFHTYALLQDKRGHTIEVYQRSFIHSYLQEGYEMIIPWSPMDVDRNRSGWGAYVVPAAIEVGELVYIPDLLENLSGQQTKRREGGLAIWNGEEFEILPEVEQHYVG